jgi:hypothetical protein
LKSIHAGKRVQKATITKKRKTVKTMDLTGDSDVEIQEATEDKMEMQESEFIPIKQLERQQQPPHRKRTKHLVIYSNNKDKEITPGNDVVTQEAEKAKETITPPKRNGRSKKAPKKSLPYHSKDNKDD